jgi:hypothetical protein
LIKSKDNDWIAIHWIKFCPVDNSHALFFSSKVEEWLMMILVMGNCLLDLFAVFDLDLEPI